MEYKPIKILFSSLMILTVSSLGVFVPHVLAQEDPMALKITSPAFVDGGPIPMEYTCQGSDLSPALNWSGVPAGAKSLVLIVDDPDAPDPKAPRMTWVHWVLYNISPGLNGLPKGFKLGDHVAGANDGINDWKQIGYGGPCPPIGRHRYFHKLYALDTLLNEMRDPTKVDVEKAMQGHVLAEAVLIGTYQKQKGGTSK